MLLIPMQSRNSIYELRNSYQIKESVRFINFAMIIG